MNARATQTSPPCVHSSSGFTLTDLLAVIAVTSVLAAIAVAEAANAKENARLARCTANLQQVNSAVLKFCGDHEQSLPGPDDTAPNNLWWWYKEEVKDYLDLTGPSSANDLVIRTPSHFILTHASISTATFSTA
jgi:Tfp pilus assembly protein PilE